VECVTVKRISVTGACAPRLFVRLRVRLTMTVHVQYKYITKITIGIRQASTDQNKLQTTCRFRQVSSVQRAERDIAQNRSRVGLSRMKDNRRI